MNIIPNCPAVRKIQVAKQTCRAILLCMIVVFTILIQTNAQNSFRKDSDADRKGEEETEQSRVASRARDSRAASRTKSAYLDGILRKEAANGFSGAVLVVRSGNTLLDKAYGSVKGVSIRRNTRFWIASAGKQFTSAAILKCMERGLLKLDDPISRFFPDAPPEKGTITVRQLLAHLSGFGQGYVSEGASDRQEAVRQMLGEKLIDQPGLKFHYANNNYQLAVAIVEIASGLAYRTFVHNELWRPAGLRNSGFSGDAGSHFVAPTIEATPERLAKVSWGGEGVYSTTHDLLRWYRALRAGRILSAESVKQLFTPLAKIQEGETALGWFLGHTEHGQLRIFTRGNDDYGANSLIYIYPESETVIIVLTHAGNANQDQSWSRLVHLKIEKALQL